MNSIEKKPSCFVSSPCWEVDCSIYIQFPKPKEIRPVRLFVAYPFHLPLRQNLISLETSCFYKEATDEYGNPWLSIPIASAEKNFCFSYKAIVKPCRISYDWNAFTEPFPIPPSRFLQPEKGIEFNSPEVLNLAKKVQGNSLEILQSAFFLVREFLKYEFQKQEYGARYAAIQGKGDCTEYASLFAAILRYHKIGARLNAGFLQGNNLHAITEVFLGGIWIPMDITNDAEPFLGIYRDFITLMRANWMLSSAMEKIVSFYYSSIGKKSLLLQSDIKVKKIIPKTPFFLSEDSPKNLIFSLHKERDAFLVSIENTTNLKISALLLLQSSNKILKAWPFTLFSQEKLSFSISTGLLMQYFSQYLLLKFFIKQSEKIYFLTSLNRMEMFNHFRKKNDFG